MKLSQLAFLSLMSCGMTGWSLESQMPPVKPRNVILMISDGCGFNTFAAADLYSTGTTKSQAYENFPVFLPLSTGSATGNKYDGTLAKQDATWVTLKPTDSAASGTAFATGAKTYDAAIGMDSEKNPLLNLSQRAQLSGKSSGVVTSVPISHATPAAFIAHNVDRNNYAEIANDMIFNGSAEVIIGGGHPLYDQDGKATNATEYKFVGGKETWDKLVAGEAANLEGKWTLVERKSAFDSLANGLAPLPERIVGVAQVRETLQEHRSGAMPATETVGQVPKIATVPELSTLSQVALRVLGRDTSGFFLMIEGGAIDWAGHDNNLARSIEEQMEFNAAVDKVIAWIEKNGGWDKNLLIITADHETGYLSGPKGLTGTTIDYELQGQGKGKMPLYKWNLKQHTNQLVPFYARGAGSERFRTAIAGKDPVRGDYTDNALVGQILMQIVGE